jgi:hypothetical protein
VKLCAAELDARRGFAMQAGASHGIPSTTAAQLPNLQDHEGPSWP